MRTTIWPEDYKYLNHMIRFVCENYPNVEDWSVEPVNARGRAIDSCSEFVRESYTDYYINAKGFIEQNQYRNILLSGKFKDNVVDFLCGTSYGLNPWLLPDGRLVTCLDARDLAPVLGKINQRKLAKYVFRDTLIEKYVKHRDQCEECYAFRFCGGGCPLRYINKEEVELIAKECKMIKDYWQFIFNNLIDDQEIFGWTVKKIELPEYPELKIRQIWRSTWKSQ